MTLQNELALPVQTSTAAAGIPARPHASPLASVWRGIRKFCRFLLWLLIAQLELFLVFGVAVAMLARSAPDPGEGFEPAPRCRRQARLLLLRRLRQLLHCSPRGCDRGARPLCAMTARTIEVLFAALAGAE